LDTGRTRFTRLYAVFGVPVDRLREPDLQRAVADQVEGNVDLDFKQALYGKDKKQDLAVDSASMANAQGGVIILGVVETNARWSSWAISADSLARNAAGSCCSSPPSSAT
jgi:hypothetical protein